MFYASYYEPRYLNSANWIQEDRLRDQPFNTQRKIKAFSAYWKNKSFESLNINRINTQRLLLTTICPQLQVSVLFQGQWHLKWGEFSGLCSRRGLTRILHLSRQLSAYFIHWPLGNSVHFSYIGPLLDLVILS